MGVVNVTPDSFSDGGQWFDTSAAVDHGHELAEAGADLVDVGGESTRPGAERPSLDAELARVLPVVDALAKAGAVVTIDTMRARVAEAAVQSGAAAVNDVSGGLADPDMLPTVVRLGVPYLAMHWRGHSDTMQDESAYADVVAEVRAELHARASAAREAGLPLQRLALDPGIGFAKQADHNWRVLSCLESFHELGHPLLVGASRKSFLGALLADDQGEPRPAHDRDSASAAVSALCAAKGAWCVRVHDVRASLDAVKVAARWAREASGD
jgi:dihydropteroate synthase